MTVTTFISRLAIKREADPREDAIRVFQRYRKHIESDRHSLVECISCGRVIHERNAEAGYYILPEDSRSVEFEGDNLWPQCPYCVAALKGNRGEFKRRLISKIGIDRVLRLEKMRDAEHGSRAALASLSKEDRLKALSTHNNSYYEYKRREYDALLRICSADGRVSSI